MSSETAMPEQMPCIQCGESVRFKAVRCHHCGASWRFPRFRLFVLPVLLVLVVGFFAGRLLAQWLGHDLPTDELVIVTSSVVTQEDEKGTRLHHVAGLVENRTRRHLRRLELELRLFGADGRLLDVSRKELSVCVPPRDSAGIRDLMPAFVESPPHVRHELVVLAGGADDDW
ncbi:MAG: hypothetical protein AAF533_02195 [Acidobacteriota bacterium]